MSNELTTEHAATILTAIGPSMREGFRKDLAEQTTEIRSIVTHHEESIRKVVDDHEFRDMKEFGKINDRLRDGEQRMSKIERKIAYAAGFIASVPIIWDLVKHHFSIQ